MSGFIASLSFIAGLQGPGRSSAGRPSATTRKTDAACSAWGRRDGTAVHLVVHAAVTLCARWHDGRTSHVTLSCQVGTRHSTVLHSTVPHSTVLARNRPRPKHPGVPH